MKKNMLKKWVKKNMMHYPKKKDNVLIKNDYNKRKIVFRGMNIHLNSFILTFLFCFREQRIKEEKAARLEQERLLKEAEPYVS